MVVEQSCMKDIMDYLKYQAMHFGKDCDAFDTETETDDHWTAEQLSNTIHPELLGWDLRGAVSEACEHLEATCIRWYKEWKILC